MFLVFVHCASSIGMRNTLDINFFKITKNLQIIEEEKKSESIKAVVEVLKVTIDEQELRLINIMNEGKIVQ